MNLTRQTAGGLAAAGAVVFVLATFGVSRARSLLGDLLGIDMPDLITDCCGCFGIVMIAAPLGLLAFTLLRKSENTKRDE